MSTGCRLLVLVAVSATILSSALTHAGPARSFAMAAARASKIPRSIRAPFRNSETMVARGFGKRSQMAKLKDMGEPWSYTKHGAAGRVYSVVDNVADLDEILNELPEESVSIELFAREMSANPALAQEMLSQFVDADHNGRLSVRELQSTLSAAASASSSSSAPSSGGTMDSTNIDVGTGGESGDMFLN